MAYGARAAKTEPTRDGRLVQGLGGPIQRLGVLVIGPEDRIRPPERRVGGRMA